MPICLAIAAFLAARQMAPAPQKGVGTGTSAPGFCLPAARGGVYRLADLERHGVVLSFINARPMAPSFSTADTSRSQIVFLKSMERQYGSAGVKFLIVDASAVQGRRPLDSAELLRFSYNWDLETLPLLMDTPSGATAREYRVSRLPTTFLIGSDGRVVHRWHGFVSAPQLSFALQSLARRRAARHAPPPAPLRANKEITP